MQDLVHIVSVRQLCLALVKSSVDIVNIDDAEVLFEYLVDRVRFPI